MKTKHTPGPWQVQIRKSHVSVTKLDDLGLDVPIAVLPGGKREGYDEMANARLIAAAPEMLKQLLLVQAYLKADNITWTGIDSAIAKAKGDAK